MDTDAKEGQKDTLPGKGQSSGEKPQEPSAQPETFTKEQAEKLAEKRADEKHAKLDTQVAKLTKDSAKLTTAIEAASRRAAAAEEALAEPEKAKDDAALKAAGDTPDALSVHLAKVAVREAKDAVKREREQLDADKAEHATEIEDAKSYNTTKLAMEIATELNVDANQLISLTDGTEEKMRKAAEILPKVGQSQKTTLPDSGGGAGGVKKLSEMTIPEQDNISDAEWFAKREAEDAEKRKSKQ